MLEKFTVTSPRGWDTYTPLRAMSHDFAVKFENCWKDSEKSFQRRPGQSPLSTTPPTSGQNIKSIFEFITNAGVSELYVWVNGVIKKYVGPTWSTSDSSFTSKVRVSQMGGILLVGDGINPAKTYNGTTWAAVTTTPDVVGGNYIGDIFHVHKGRMYAAGDPSQQLTVLYSDTESADGVNDWEQTTASNGGFLDLSGVLGEGDEITGLTSYIGYLVVFLKNHIVFYSGDDPNTAENFQVQKVIEGIGCLSHDSIQGIGNDVIFLSEYGFKTLQQIMVQGDAAATDKSIPINNFITDAIRRGNVTTSDVRSMNAQDLGAYLVTFGNQTLAYHYQFDGWSRWTGLQPQLYAALDGTLYSGDEWLHKILTTNKGDTLGTDSEVAISMVWQPPPFSAKVKSRYNRIELVYSGEASEVVTLSTWINNDENTIRTNNITLTPNVLISDTDTMIWTENDSSNPQTKWAAGPTGLPNWGGNASVAEGEERLPVNGYTEHFNIKLTNNNITNFTVSELRVYRNDGGFR